MIPCTQHTVFIPTVFVLPFFTLKDRKVEHCSNHEDSRESGLSWIPHLSYLLHQERHM